MYSSEIQVRVRYAETDQMNVVYHGNYAQYFEVGRVESIRQLGMSYKDLEATGVIMPVVEWTAKFLRPAHYDDLLTVKTTLRELPAGHRIEFHVEVFNESGKLLTVGKVLLYFLLSATMEKTKMPDELVKKLAPYFGSSDPATSGSDPAVS
ncbi:MAG TPA: thioesterase family protein [Puia sp.]|nr:thioesterase family protein [Puia sp.]